MKTNKPEYRLFDDSYIFHVHCLKFCFHRVIQNGLTKTKTEWKTHRIHGVCNSKALLGVPDVLYFCSKVRSRYITDILLSKIKKLQSWFVKNPQTFWCSNEFVELATALMSNNSLEVSRNKRYRGYFLFRLMSLIDYI